MGTHFGLYFFQSRKRFLAFFLYNNYLSLSPQSAIHYTLKKKTINIYYLQNVLKQIFSITANKM